MTRGCVRLTPLCPAGHLPHKEGDRQAALPSLRSRTVRWARLDHESISPLVGEMPGRAEGGKPHAPSAPCQCAPKR
ncbi:hypothetical protein CFBP5877_07555 [Agrobacterium tumefaciens]|uniref:Lytic murein transglycosylase n=1 Tax=Agrobacterium tumefaciens TaxID=358 RepID=A0AAE6BC92_AGRTU|nr:hypothetical protein CFBP5499_08025 [Agrobacterium tumefaciens]QCL80291.1 hypothetical protein CFBP5877_07555 [Agrobacterium tumefaciens]